jgi:hypothetical protein
LTPTNAVKTHIAAINQNELYPAIAKARPMTYALLVPQSPYKIAAALGASTFRGLFVFPTIISQKTDPKKPDAPIVTPDRNEVNH